MSIVNQIVGRCHVGESNLSVIRYVISRLRDGHRTFRAMPRQHRRELLRSILDAHRENRELYQWVMRGGMS